MFRRLEKRDGKYIIIMLISVVFGIILGIGNSRIPEEFAPLNIGDLSLVFNLLIPLFLFIIVAIFIYVRIYAGRIKKENYSNEEGSVYDLNIHNISLVSGIGTTIMIFTIPLFMVMFESVAFNWILYLAGISLLATQALNEILFLKLIGKVEPKKNIDYGKLSYGKEYYDALDERERKRMGIVGAKLMYSIHIVFALIVVILVGLSVVLEFSGYEFIIVAFIWGALMIIILFEDNKQEKLRKKEAREV